MTPAVGEGLQFVWHVRSGHNVCLAFGSSGLDFIRAVAWNVSYNTVLTNYNKRSVFILPYTSKA
jgi:hypothetical protein